MSPNDVLLYFAAETTAAQPLRFKLMYLHDITDLAHHLLNFLSYVLSMLQNFGKYCLFFFHGAFIYGPYCGLRIFLVIQNFWP